MLITVDGREPIKDAALASIDKKRAFVVRIPLNKEFYSFGLGTNLSFAGSYFEKPVNENKLDSLVTLMQELFGYPIDGYLYLKWGSVSFDEQALSAFQKKLATISFFWKIPSYKSWLDARLYTNFSIGDIVSLVFKFRDIPPDRLEVISLLGGKEKTLYRKDIDKVIGTSLLDNGLSNEAAAVEIKNSSKVEGASEMIKRLVEHVGGNAIVTGSVNEKGTKVVLGNNKPLTATRLAAYLGVPVTRAKIESGADILLVIGDDYFEKYY